MKCSLAWALLALLGALPAAPLRALCAPAACCEPPQEAQIEVRQRTLPQDGPPRAFDMQMVLVRVDSAFDMWFKTQPATTPQFEAVSRLHPFDVCVPLVTMAGIGAAPDGTGHVSLDVSITGADGVTEVTARDLPAWNGPLPPPGGLVLNQTPFGLSFDDKEALGTLTISVEARDEASGATVRREARVELVPWMYGDAPTKEEFAQGWFNDYYRAPKPGEAVRAWLEYAPLANADSPTYNFAVLGFFQAVFADKPWLVDHLAGRVPVPDAEQAWKLCLLLHLVGQDARLERLGFTPEQLAAIRQTIAGLDFPDPYAPISSTDQLDMLWGEFLATGRYAPFRQLVTAFRLAPFAGAVDAYKDSAQTAADQEAAVKGLAFRMAVWSVDSNLGQHPLLVDYGLWMLANETLSAEESGLLAGLLAKHAPDLVRIRKQGDPEAWPGEEPPR